MSHFAKLLRVAALPAALALVAQTASAQSITIGDGSGLRGSTISVPVTFNAGGNVAGYNTVIEYDPAPLSGNPTITAGAATCTIDPALNTISIIRFTFPAAALPTEVACTVNFPIDAAAAFAVYPLTHDPASTAFPDTSANPVVGTVDDGSFEVVDTPPEAPAVAFAPNGGPISLAQGGGAVGDTSAASVIAVTTSGGAGTGSASYNCTVPAGFAATNSSNASIAVGSDPADLSVTCTLGATASSANMTCGVTDIAGSRDVSFTLNCPAGASAVYSSAPAAGAALATCNGAPGSTQTRSITITNTGTPANPDSAADDLALACSITSGGTNFAIVAGPTSPLEAGSSTTVDVQCTVPDTGSITGELDCNGNLYGLSATVQTVPPPVPTPAIVPATSEWSKLVLIALLAGLGALVVGFRRHG